MDAYPATVTPFAGEDGALCFSLVSGIDTYYERYGSGAPLILIPPGGSHTSTWRFNVGALSYALARLWTRCGQSQRGVTTMS